MVANSNLSQVEAQIQQHTNEYQVVVVNKKKIADAKANLAALRKLANNRFLQGNLLNALQNATVPGVQLVRLVVGQTYSAAQAGTAQTAPPVTERIIVTLDALDYGSDPGDQVNKFKDAIGQEPYFRTQLGKTNDVRLANLSPPQVDPSGKASVVFTLQCTYPDRTR
jgi:hypothetical protein